MPILAYKKHRFSKKTMDILEKANEIVAEYSSQGLVMSLRQLYYQFVSRGIAPNQKQFYKNLSYLLVEARMCGEMDWLAIEDMTRFLRTRQHFIDPAHAVDWLVGQYGEDLWQDQPKRFEVWIEKDSLIGTIDRVCEDLDVGYFACRGYSSATELWKASQRLMDYPQDDVTIIHMGDFDPTGLDATRDIQAKLDIFTDGAIRVKRIAITKKQIRKYNAPPFEAKIKDSRYKAYVAEHGDTCWELDALPPDKLAALVRETIEPHIVKTRMKKAKEAQEENRDDLRMVSEHDDQWRRLPRIAEDIGALEVDVERQKVIVTECRRELRDRRRQEEVSAKGISRLQKKVRSLEQAKEKDAAKITKLKAAAKKRARRKSKKKKSR